MTDDRHIVPLMSVPSEIEASIIVAALEEEGITSTMSGDFTADFRVALPSDVQILVAEKDVETARKVLERVRQEDTEIDWSRVDVGQPEE